MQQETYSAWTTDRYDYGSMQQENRFVSSAWTITIPSTILTADGHKWRQKFCAVKRYITR